MARVATFSYDFSPGGGQENANACPLKPCRWGRSNFGLNEPPELINRATGLPYLEGNSQEFKAGDMVQLTNGAVTAVLTGDDEPIIGFALTDATNVTSGNAPIRIMPVNSHDEYIMHVYSATAANTDKNSVALLVGGMYNLAQATIVNYDGSTTYCTVVNIDSQTDQRVLITGIVEDPSLTSSSQYIPVYVKFLPVFYESGVPSHQGLQLDT